MWLLLCIQQCRLMPFKICSYQITLPLIREHGSVLIWLFSVRVSRSCYNVAYLKLTIIVQSVLKLTVRIWAKFWIFPTDRHIVAQTTEGIHSSPVTHLVGLERHTDRQTRLQCAPAQCTYCCRCEMDLHHPGDCRPASGTYTGGEVCARARACVRRVWRHGQVMTEITRDP